MNCNIKFLIYRDEINQVSWSPGDCANRIALLERLTNVLYTAPTASNPPVFPLRKGELKLGSAKARGKPPLAKGGGWGGQRLGRRLARLCAIQTRTALAIVLAPRVTDILHKLSGPPRGLGHPHWQKQSH